MDETILLALLQDGLTTGAIYVLLAVGLLIAFTVTRVIFIPQGDLVSFAALTLASLIGHRVPGTLWLLDGLCAAALAVSLARGRIRAVLPYGVAPALLTLACWAASRYGAPTAVSMLLSLTIVTALGPLLYRFAYEPLGESSLLPLLIVSMALHFVLIGIALYCFGAEGVSTPALTEASFDAGPIEVSGQSL
ncbi:MAG: branched-chain amino acid transport system permease protein, partial [Acetobacteraceae bacterium]|nr:branched-chain amino acid transport system permease protein [Acetobacteraceae bacterium]